MTQNRNLSIHADYISTAGVLNPSGGGTGITTTPTNGQIPIGNGTNYTAATITAGTGITVTNGAGTISLAATGGNFQNQLFTASGTWTAPTGVTSVRVTVIAGGGGSYNDGTNSGYGGTGGSAIGYYTVTPTTVYTVTVGTGGVGVATGTGGAGGTSSFGALISATGGSGGATASAHGTGGAGSSGNIMNSVAQTYYSFGMVVPYFRTTGYSTTPTGYMLNAGTTAAKVFSVTPATTSFGGAGVGGSIFAANGGMGGIVFVEWVG